MIVEKSASIFFFPLFSFTKHAYDKYLIQNIVILKYN